MQLNQFVHITHFVQLPPPSTPLPLPETKSVNSFWLLIKGSLSLSESILAIN